MKEYRLRSRVVVAGTRPSDGKDSVYLKVPAPHPDDADGFVPAGGHGFLDLEVPRDDINAWGKVLNQEVDILIRLPDAEPDTIVSCGMCGVETEAPPRVMSSKLYALGGRHLGDIDVRSSLEGEDRAGLYEEFSRRLAREATEYRAFIKRWWRAEEMCESCGLMRWRCGCERA